MTTHVNIIPTPGRSQSGVSMLEYMGLLLVILGLFLLSSQFARNAIQGYFRSSGEQLSYLRQHDPRRTRDCIWDDRLQVWYSEKCLQHYVHSAPPSADSALTMTCRQDLSRTACSSTSFSAKCPATCRYADLKMGTCAYPCHYLSPPLQAD